jgi:hypothetical protein
MAPSRQAKFENEQPRSDLDAPIQQLRWKPLLPEAAPDETSRLPLDETWCSRRDMACRLLEYLAQDQLFPNIFSFVRVASRIFK